MKKTGFSVIVLLLLLAASSKINAQWSTAALTQGRYGIGATAVGNKAIFAGGAASYYLMSNRADIYDAATGTWATKFFSQGRKNIAAATVNDRALFAGGIGRNVNGFFYSSKVDIYNNATGLWTAKTVSQARAVSGVGVAAGKAVFAGGIKAINQNTYQPVTSNKVDIYNYATNTFSSATLSTTRSEIATASIGSKIIFAGGVKNYNSFGEPIVSNVADIYDAATGTWSTATLSVARTGIAVAVVGNKAFFAGGYSWLPTPVYYNTVDVYDASTNTWSTATLSEARANATPVVAGNLAFFAGGLGGSQYSDRVDIYDGSTGTWSTASISAAKSGMVAAVTNHRVMFAGGGSLGYTAPVEVYDRDNGTWSVENLSQARVDFAAVSVNNKAVFAGGRSSNGWPLYGSGQVDIYQDATLRPAVGRESLLATEIAAIKIYPNPVKDVAHLMLPKPMRATIRVCDITGRALRTMETDGGELVEIPVGGLPAATYLVQVILENGQAWVGKMQVE